MGKPRTLRKQGLLNLIVAVLREYEQGGDVCNQNECTLAISHLIRVYGDLFSPHRYVSTAVLNDEGKRTLEHVVPVIFIVRTFMLWADAGKGIDRAEVERYLDQYSYLCWVVKATEGTRLRDAGFEDKLPKEAYDGGREIQDIWARYTDTRVRIQWVQDIKAREAALKRIAEDERRFS